VRGAAARAEGWAVLALLVGASAVAWAVSLRMAAQLEGPHAHHAHAADAWALFAMWAAMTVGMMIPPELPTLSRIARGRAHALRTTGAFLGGYLAPWAAFCVGAAALQGALQRAGLVDALGASRSRTLAALLLCAAGVAQLSPLKRACLSRSRAPALREDGARQAALAGLRHGAFSVGSCGMLMLALLVPGVMSVPWMVGLTAWLILEALAPAHWPVGAYAGAALLALGALRLFA
jgi:predicted metal-binding membrane protein